MKILMVDDDQQLVSFVKMGLEDQGMIVTTAYDGNTGERMALSGNFDLIILDVMLPVVNGFEICRHLRNHDVDTPVLMLTSLDSTEDKVSGLDIGADDYLGKPFEFPELLARVRALIRRHEQKYNSPVLRIADLEIDLESKEARRAGDTIKLTATEFRILALMAQQPGKVFERVEIAEKIWGFNFNTGTNVIDVHISALRRKIDKDQDLKLIHTRIGSGYLLTENQS